MMINFNLCSDSSEQLLYYTTQHNLFAGHHEISRFYKAILYFSVEMYTIIADKK